MAMMMMATSTMIVMTVKLMKPTTLASGARMHRVEAEPAFAFS